MHADDTSRRIRQLLIAGACFVFLQGGGADQPYTATSVMPVTLEITGTCSVRASDLSFGSYLANASTPLAGQTTLILECTSGVDVEIGLDAGQGAGATVQERRMMSGTDALRYGLYQDAARVQVWGDTVGVDTVHMQGVGTPQDVTVYGQVPARQSVPAGLYGDIITVRVYF